MLRWLKAKFHQKKVAGKIRRHMATATGSPLQRSVIAVAMTAIEHELVQKERHELSIADQEAFMMVYECVVMWSLMHGFASAGMPASVQAGIVAAIRGHFAQHAWYAADDFERIWEETQKWMPEFAKPTKDGNFWPAAALVQIPHAAGFQPNFAPGYLFGSHVLTAITSLADSARRTAEAAGGNYQ